MTKSKKINLCICLSHKANINNTLSIDSKSRLIKAVSVFNKNSLDFFITTGWKYKDSMTESLSTLLSKAAIKEFNIPKDNIIELSEAKDTVGEALFLKRLSLTLPYKINEIHVITSDWHIKRAKEIFKFIFGNDNEPLLIFYEIKGAIKEHKIEQKNNSIIKFRGLTENCKSGDFESIFNQVMNFHPLYNQYKDL